MRAFERGSVAAKPGVPGVPVYGVGPHHLPAGAHLVDQREIRARTGHPGARVTRTRPRAVVAAREHRPDVEVVATLAVPQERVGRRRIARSSSARLLGSSRAEPSPGGRRVAAPRGWARRSRTGTAAGLRRAPRSPTRTSARDPGTRTRSPARRGSSARCSCALRSDCSRSGSEGPRNPATRAAGRGSCRRSRATTASPMRSRRPCAARRIPTSRRHAVGAEQAEERAIRRDALVVTREAVELAGLRDVRLGAQVERRQEISDARARPRQRHRKDRDPHGTTVRFPSAVTASDAA
jgi:hypothetical protein